MISPSDKILRELVDAVDIPSAYRSRVESYGGNASRSLLSLYDTLKEIVQDDPGSDARSL